MPLAAFYTGFLRTPENFLLFLALAPTATALVALCFITVTPFTQDCELERGQVGGPWPAAPAPAAPYVLNPVLGVLDRRLPAL